MPFDLLEFLLGHHVVAFEYRGRPVTGHSHDPKIVIPGEPQVVDRAVPQAVECEVSHSRLQDGLVPGRLEVKRIGLYLKG